MTVVDFILMSISFGTLVWLLAFGIRLMWDARKDDLEDDIQSTIEGWNPSVIKDHLSLLHDESSERVPDVDI